MIFRRIKPEDFSCFEDFLYHAIFIPQGAEPVEREVIFQPEIYIYIENFGSQAGDIAVVAEENQRIVGMAWTRIIPAYGSVDDETPELAISVLEEFRGQGVGHHLMGELFRLLQEQGYEKTSLSVQKANQAVRFYQDLGYEVVAEKEEEYIMVRRL